MIKRYCLFGGAIYYASGGFNDFLASFETREEVVAAKIKWDAENVDYSWSQIVDLQEGTMTIESGFTSPLKLLAGL